MVIVSIPISQVEVIKTLEYEATLMLATCAGNRVTIRPMSHINDGINIFFQTSSDSLKMQEIRTNSNVALCIGTYEIEGTAIELGHPLDEKSVFFAKSYKEKHPGSFEKYSAYENETVVMVKPKLVWQWRYENNQPVVAELVLV